MMQSIADGRSRSVTITALGRRKRIDAQRHWKAAQSGLNQLLGTQRVMALHALINEALDVLKPNEAGADNV